MDDRVPWFGVVLTVTVVLGASEPAAAGDLWSGIEPSPTDESARTIPANPSGIGTLAGTSTELAGYFGLRALGHRPTDGEEPARSTQFQALPRLAHSSDLGTQRWSFGLEVGAPWSWKSDWSGDGPGRFRSLYGELTGVAFTPAVAFSPVEQLSVGASASYAITAIESYRAFDFAPFVAREEGADPNSVPRGDPGNEGREYIDMEGSAFGVAGGVTWTPGRFRLALAYQTRMFGELSGTYRAIIPRNDYYRDRYLGDIERDAELDADWPGVLRAGGTVPIEGVGTADLSLAWRRWSSVDDVELDVAESEQTASFDRKLDGTLNDTISVDAGFGWEAADALRLRAGVGFASSPLPASTVSRQAVEGATVSMEGTAHWRVGEAVGLRLGYHHRHLLAREVGQQEAAFGAAGTYRQDVGFVQTALSYRLE